MNTARIMVLVLCAPTMEEFAMAGVIYSQPPTYRVGRGSDLTLISRGLPKGFQTSDEFILPTAQVLRSITWYGSYFPADVFIPLIDDFTIEIYRDTDGLPAALPFASYAVGDAVNRLDTGMLNDHDAVEYQYTANIPDTSLEAGTVYHLSIYGNTVQTASSAWIWDSSAPRGLPDRFRSPVGTGEWIVPQAALHHAFKLHNTRFVPEPITALMLLMCCLVVPIFWPRLHSTLWY